MSGDSLRVAAERGYADDVIATLEGGANPCSRDRWGLTALHFAVWNGHVECTKIMCANDMGIDVKLNSKELARLLESQGVDVPFFFEETLPDVLKPQRKQYPNADAFDLNAPASAGVPRTSCINLSSQLGLTALHTAAMEGDKSLELARVLLLAGADKNLPDRLGMTALEHAIGNNSPQLTDMLGDDAFPSEYERSDFQREIRQKYGIKEQQSRKPKDCKYLKGVAIVPDRLPPIPKELQLPEDYIMPYAHSKNRIHRGLVPLKALEFSLEQMGLNERRRNRLANSLETKQRADLGMDR